MCRTCEDYDGMGFGYACPCNHNDEEHMLTFPPQRYQGDNAQDIASDNASLDCQAADDDRTRQEFKNDADINIILQRFGVHAPMKDAPLFHEVDFNLDFQQALHAVADVERAYSQLPPRMRERFETWDQFLSAIESGQITVKIRDTVETPAPTIVEDPV